MRTLEQNPQHHNKENISGQEIDKVYSEITELLKTERVTDIKDVDARCDVKMELIKKYYRAITFCNIKKKNDDTMASAEKLHQEFLKCELEEVISVPEIIDERYVNVITIESDERTMKIVPDCELNSTLDRFDKTVRLRLLIRLSKIASQLASLLAPEINLHKDYTEKGMTPDSLKQRYSSD